MMIPDACKKEELKDEIGESMNIEVKKVQLHGKVSIDITDPALPKNYPCPRVENIVITFNLGCEVDLQKVVVRVRNAEYNPKKFAAVTMRIITPRSVALIFASGKMIITGTKTEAEAYLAARKYARILQKVDVPAKLIDFKVQNMIAVVDTKTVVNLDDLAVAHCNFCQFNPELFPAATYRMVNPRVCIMIFVNGKLVITGAKSRVDVNRAFQQIYPITQAFKKKR